MTFQVIASNGGTSKPVTFEGLGGVAKPYLFTLESAQMHVAELIRQTPGCRYRIEPRKSSSGVSSPPVLSESFSTSGDGESASISGA